MPWDDDTPNPGSDLAQARGCLCPVLDNCHGRHAPWPGGGWYLRPDCPLHGEQAGDGQ